MRHIISGIRIKVGSRSKFDNHIILPGIQSERNSRYVNPLIPPGINSECIPGTLAHLSSLEFTVGVIPGTLALPNRHFNFSFLT